MVTRADLEEWQNDPTANAPEVAYDAPEVSRRGSLHAPEQKVFDGLEFRFGDAGLEPTPLVDDKEAVIDDKNASKSSSFLRKRRWPRIAIIVLLCLSILGLAVGLGVDLGTRKSGDPTSVSAPSTNQSSSTVAQPSSPTASASPAADAPLKKGMMSGSSIAAATDIDNSRRVFFQDISNDIRVASASGGSDAWDASSSSVIATDARPSTPLAAYVRLTARSFDINFHHQSQTYLFYVTTNNTLGLLEYDGNGWAPDTSIYMNYSRLSPFTVSKQSRSFTASVVVESVLNGVDTEDFTNFGVLLMLHDENENMVVLYGYEQPYQYSTAETYDLSIVWNNITGPFQNELWKNSTTNCTFSNIARYDPASVSVTVNCPMDTTQFWSLNFYTQNHTNASLIPDFFNDDWGTWPQTDPSSSAAPPVVVVGANNTATSSGTPFTLYLENNTLSEGESGLNLEPSLATPFEYANIAVTNPAGISSPLVFLYHQINESAFAEDTYDYSLRQWSTRIVQVETAT